MYVCVILNLFWKPQAFVAASAAGGTSHQGGLEWGDVGGAQNSTPNSCSGQPWGGGGGGREHTWDVGGAALAPAQAPCDRATSGPPGFSDKEAEVWSHPVRLCCLPTPFLSEAALFSKVEGMWALSKGLPASPREQWLLSWSFVRFLSSASG